MHSLWGASLSTGARNTNNHSHLFPLPRLLLFRAWRYSPTFWTLASIWVENSSSNMCSLFTFIHLVLRGERDDLFRWVSLIIPGDLYRHCFVWCKHEHLSWLPLNDCWALTHGKLCARHRESSDKTEFALEELKFKAGDERVKMHSVLGIYKGAHKALGKQG